MTGCHRRILFLSVLFILAGCGRGPNPEPILIGHLAPFSGPDKELGEHAKQGMLLAIEELNKEENRISGRTINVLHPTYAPEEPDKLQAVAVRLMTVNRVVALLGGGNAGQAERLQRATQAYDVPLVTFAGLPPELLGENVFSVNAGLAFQGQVLAQFARQELKADRVAVMVDGRSASCTTLAAVFSKQFSKTNVNHVTEWNYKNGNDLSDLVERVKKLQPNAILLAGMAGDLDRLRAKLRAATIKTPVLFAGDEEHLMAANAERDAHNGICVATPYVADESQVFAKTYKERFNQLPDLQAALAYDGVRLIHEAMRRAQSALPAKIRTTLAEMTTAPFDRSLSGSWTFDKNHAARRPLFVGPFANGKVSNPRRYEPDGK